MPSHLWWVGGAQKSQGHPGLQLQFLSHLPLRRHLIIAIGVVPSLRGRKTQRTEYSAQTPQARSAPPESQLTTRPAGTSFSTSTKPAIAATQARFMTPPTKSSAMSAQQQPRQKRPWRSPITSVPPSASPPRRRFRFTVAKTRIMGAAPGSIIATIMTAHMPPASSASVALHGPAGAMCIAAMSAISWPRRERESQASRVSPARPSRAATPSRRATASISSSRPPRARGGGRARTPSAWDALLRFHSPCGSLCGRTLTEPRMRTIRIGHSPDPDDAFMFYALTAGKVRIPGVRIEHMLEDIESLNRRARTAELEVTAVSFATYLLVADGYRMMDPGASMGKGYGPILVAREPMNPRILPERVVAIPGSHTTAALLLRLYVGDPPLIEVAFDKIPSAVLEGQADVGLLIHEGQITHA